MCEINQVSVLVVASNKWEANALRRHLILELKKEENLNYLQVTLLLAYLLLEHVNNVFIAVLNTVL